MAQWVEPPGFRHYRPKEVQKNRSVELWRSPGRFESQLVIIDPLFFSFFLFSLAPVCMREL